jgi:hypothetical protein
MIPLKSLCQGFAGGGAENDPLAPVRANFPGNHGDPCLHEHFQGHLNVSAAQVLFSARVRITHGIKQAAASENLGAKMPAIGTGFEELLQQK